VLLVSVIVVSALALNGRLIFAAGGRHTLPGHLIPALKHAQAKPHANTNAPLSLSIDLNLRNTAQLNTLLAAQDNKDSPLYRHYLTSDQFKQQFGPTQANVDAVTAFLRGQGLTVQSVSPNNTIIHASGTVATVQNAFQTQIEDFTLDGRTVYAPTNEPSVPDEVGNLIANVGGLNDVIVYHPLGLNKSAQSQVPATGPGGGYTPSELRAAYDMNPLISAADGTGQTAAIFELDGYLPADVNQYLSFYGLGAPKYSNVLVDGATNTPGKDAFEVELDMETISAIAPGASQKIYIGPNTGQGVLDTYNQIVTDNVAKVTSTSWGLCEAHSAPASLTALDNIFAQGAAQGQAVFAASGDNGAYDCRDGATLNVDSPASDPHVVGVGGTHLTTGVGGSYGSESVWANNPLGGGGGLSTFFAKPAYQTGPGVNNSYSNGERQVPDVSADADPSSGYSVYCTAGSTCAGAGWVVVGGTSAAAPLWAAIAIDTNQYLAASGKPGLGGASAALYSLFNSLQKYPAYHDITVGNNLFYPATAGYDQASGIGTPDVWNFARDALGFPHADVTPGAVAVTTAPSTNAPSQNVTLRNTGGGTLPLNWSGGWASSDGGAVGSLPSWVSLSPSSGSLAAGASQTLTLTFTTSGLSAPQTLSGFLTLSDPAADVVTTYLPVTVVLANVAKTWYFAEGFTGPNYTEYLTLANPTSSAASVSVQYLLGSGAPVSKGYSVPATSRKTLNVNTEIGNDHDVSLVVTSDTPLIAERPMYFVYRSSVLSVPVPSGTDVLGATSLGTQYDFGYLDTTAGHDTYLTILNQQATDTTVTTQYFPAAGGAPLVRSTTAPAHSRATIHVNTDAGVPSGSYSASVTLSQPGFVERPLYLQDGTGATGAADVIGVSAPRSAWYFAEGFTDPHFFERYILANPSAAGTANVTVQFLRGDGTTLTTTRTLAPGQQQVVDANALLGLYVNNSAVVTSTGAPILAERFISFTYIGSGIGSAPGASDVLGAAAPSALFYFAEGFTGGGFAQWLTLENPNAQSATVTVRYLPETGAAPTVQTVVVDAHSRYTAFTNAVMPSQSFAMVVEANLPIVAERPLYFDFVGPRVSGATGGTTVIGYQP
jgi:kumamolisin